MVESPASKRYHAARVARRALEREQYSEQVEALHTKVQEMVQRDEEAKAPRQITGPRHRDRLKAKPANDFPPPDEGMKCQPMTTVIGSGMVNLGE
jgi:hypothetical protein